MTAIAALELDTGPDVLEVPQDLADALDADAQALRFFASLTYAEQRSYVLSLAGARTAAARQRQVARAIARLRAGRTR